MSDERAVDPQAPEVDLPEEWREHVRELRGENARRRKENQELRAQLAALAHDAEQAKAAHQAAAAQAQHEADRLAPVRRRLKELELARIARETLEAAAARRAEAGRAVDLERLQRLLDRVPSPVSLEGEVEIDDAGRASIEAAAQQRLEAFLDELVDLVAAEPQVAPPPVGGQPPRPARPATGPGRNAWDPEDQASAGSKARAGLRRAASRHAAVLDGLAQL
ncbi:MAG: hypothetical protein ACOC8A_02390 [bacterium]